MTLPESLSWLGAAICAVAALLTGWSAITPFLVVAALVLLRRAETGRFGGEDD